MDDREKNVRLQYFALLREQRGLSYESRITSAVTLKDLFAELKKEYELGLEAEDLKVAVNGEFTELSASLKDGDEIVFIPPVAGGAIGPRDGLECSNISGTLLRLEGSKQKSG
ncbi:MAG: Molybdopterin synthase sulfur carrier subunit [Candidatus Moanabacter tarae]|uniref:Molybdopterin synthase sulfur carrier subunit n=1 Tax=Candidatus Moanibacter tarae TaxID=2200854 RepID=A0A2Z4ARR4_9BACT|nr:MAG: Molybdopterin synthase sulfur carrier subunit [Candidatus Moanabacter tarae]|tara:strand:- start:13804 stop:14142 length:339 start_codon:yes stop_codon:yes gene_type:complete